MGTLTASTPERETTKWHSLRGKPATFGSSGNGRLDETAIVVVSRGDLEERILGISVG